jgi:hypothetical protein
LSGGLVQKFGLLRELIGEKFKSSYRLGPASEDTLLGLLAVSLAFTGRAESVRAALDLLSSQEIRF